MKPHFRIVLLTVLLVLAVALRGVADTRYVLITILHTNDIHGHVMPRDGNGGLARAATLVRQVRDQMPNVLLLDAGDIVHGTPEDYFSGGRATIGAMNAARYRAATSGNHDYDFGLDTLKAAASFAWFPFLAANVRAASGGQWDSVAPYTIFVIDGVRVAVVGLTTMETVTLNWPGRIKDIVVDEPMPIAAEAIPCVRAESDVVVVLSHLGAELDEKLAQTVPGIDFIVGGHSHTYIQDWRWVGDTLITQAGSYARALGRIDFIVRLAEAGARIVSVNGRRGSWNELPRPPLDKTYPTGPLIPVTESVCEDPAVLEAYLPYRAATQAVFAEVIGEAAEPVPCVMPGFQETSAGNLVADAVREFAKSDVAVIAAKSVVKGLDAGPMTVGSAFNMIKGYTRQHIVVAQMTGAELRLGLENRLAGNWGLCAQVSGASLSYTRSGNRATVTDLNIGGSPVDPTRVYTVAAQAYVMMDMMDAAPGTTVVAEPVTTTREALIDYVRSHCTITPPDVGRIRYVAASPEP